MSSRKPPGKPDDWDDFDIPTWDDAAPAQPSRSKSPQSRSAKPTSRSSYTDPFYDDPTAGSPAPPRRTAQQAQPRSAQPPRLSNRVPTRTTRPSSHLEPQRDPYNDTEIDTRYRSESFLDTEYREPVAPRTAAPSRYELYAESTVDAGWDDVAGYETNQVIPHEGRSRNRPSRPAVSIPRPDIGDTPMAAIVAAAVVGLLLLVGITYFEFGRLGSIIPWHLDSRGNVDSWATTSTIWQIPFGSFMALVIGLVVGAVLWNRDRFAARFFLVSMCAVQILAWVAIIDQIW